MPPRAHNHNGFSSPEPPGVSSPPLPLSRGLTPSAGGRHDPLPTSLLDRFHPATTLGVTDDRFSALAVNGLPPPVASASLEPVSMTARRPVTSRNHHPCYHCRMCEQVTTTVHVKPNRHRQRDSAVELSRVGGVYWALSDFSPAVVVMHSFASKNNN